MNKVINMLAVFYAHGRESEAFKRHVARIDDYLWVAEDGMKMQGYNGSQSWDTSFAMQALAAAGPAFCQRHADSIARVYGYLDATQIKNDVPMRDRFYRTISKGGWPFSTNDHGWPIADCTSEGMKATLAVKSLAAAGALSLGDGFADGFGTLRSGLIAPQRYYDAVQVSTRGAGAMCIRYATDALCRCCSRSTTPTAAGQRTRRCGAGSGTST